MVYQEEATGQMVFANISTNPLNKIVQSNSMILGRQDLTLNEAKLVRIAIMQILAHDMDFSPYKITPSEFAMMVGNSDPKNVYHRAADICDSLLKKQLEVVGNAGKWLKINWVSYCVYDTIQKEIHIKLNEDLKPFLIGLVEKGLYTQYEGQYALSMSSVYALRLYELIEEAIKTKVFPKNGLHIKISRATIVDACMLYNRDEKSGKIITDQKTGLPSERYNVAQLRKKVIELGCREINEKTEYYIPYTSSDPKKCVKPIKKGREIVAFDFYVNLKKNEDSLNRSSYSMPLKLSYG